jgi:hypothetical protein
LQGGCVERRGGSDGTRIFTRGRDGTRSPARARVQGIRCTGRP